MLELQVSGTAPGSNQPLALHRTKLYDATAGPRKSASRTTQFCKLQREVQAITSVGPEARGCFTGPHRAHTQLHAAYVVKCHSTGGLEMKEATIVDESGDLVPNSV